MAGSWVTGPWSQTKLKHIFDHGKPVASSLLNNIRWGAPGPPIPTSLVGMASNSQGRQSRTLSTLKIYRSLSCGLSNSPPTRRIASKKASELGTDFILAMRVEIWPNSWSISSWECPVRRQDTPKLRTVWLLTAAAQNRRKCPFLSSLLVLSHWMMTSVVGRCKDLEARFKAQATHSVEKLASFGKSASVMNIATKCPCAIAALKCKRGLIKLSNNFALKHGCRGRQHFDWSIPSTMTVSWPCLFRDSALSCQ